MSLLFDSIFLDIFSIIIALLCVIIAYFKYCYSYWSRKGVYQIAPEIPYGSTKKMIKQTLSYGEIIRDFYQELKSKGQKFGGYYVFTTPNFLISDPEILKLVMSKDFSHFSDRTAIAHEEKEPLTGHLVTLRGQKWKAMRQKLTPTFTSGKIKMMFDIMLECAGGLENILDEKVKNKEDIDIKDLAGRFGTDIIGSCAFGLDCNSIRDENSEFRKYGKKIFTPSKSSAFKHIIMVFLPQLFHLFGFRMIEEDVTNFFTKVVRDTIEYREKNNIVRNDFLQLLMNIKNTGNVDADKNSIDEEMKEGLTFEVIAAQCYIFFLAGFETSSTSISYCLYDLSVNQEIQDKVRNEILDKIKKYDGKLTYDGIQEMQYLEMALFESMRLHSAISVMGRRCTKDYKIPNTDIVIEKGTEVSIPFYGIHSDPEYYPEPEKYDPERFSKEEIAKRPPFTFLPFGEGPRACIAERFGLLETKIGLVALLKNHRFTLSKKTQIPLKINPKSHIFQVIGGIWLNAERI